MNISAPFIRRPVATTLIMLGVLLLGLVTYEELPIAALPSVERPTISVWAPLPGASAATVAAALAQPLERQIGLISGVADMSSYSATGGASIDVQFDLSKDIDAAAGAVRAAIAAAGPNLPRDYGWPPIYWKANTSGFAVVVLALTSEVVPPGELYNYADNVLAPKLSQLEGVARVWVSGAERSAVRVQVSAGRIAAMNLSLEDIRRAVVAASRNLPKGRIDRDGQSFTIEAADQLITAGDYREVIVAWRGGAAVRLGDIATVSDSVINTKLDGWYNNDRGVVLYVYKQPDANIVELVDAVKRLVPELKTWLPPAIRLNVVYDRTLLIRASIADVQLTIALAIALVVLVMALFLKRFWATVIPSLTIPVALAATVSVMAANDYSLDNLSLMALTIAVGFVVDDAIIVIENVKRRMDLGETAMEAALAGTRQMSFTIVSITAALTAAMIPVLFMPDVVGRYFREFGVTLVSAIAASALVSVSLTPMLCSRLLRGGSAVAPGGRVAAAAAGFYRRSLDWTLDHRWAGLALVVAAALATAGLYVAIPKGFMPTQDTGVIYVRTVANANISFAAMEDSQRQVGEMILGDPAVSALTSYIGEGNGNALSVGWLTIALKPPEERRLTVQQVVERLRRRLAAQQNVRVFFTPAQDLNLGVGGGASRYQYTLWGADGEQVLRGAEAMIRRIRALPETVDVIGNWEVSGLQAGLAIDRTRASGFGVTPAAVDNVLYDAFGQRQLNIIYLPTNFTRVILEVEPAAQTDPTGLAGLYVPGAGGRQVPLSAITRPWRSHAVMWVRHSGQFPSATISFDLKPGRAISQAIASIREAERGARLPAEVRAEFRGEAGEAAKATARQLVLFGAALVAVYIVLGALYESYVHPLTILSTLPTTVLGALLALWLTGTQFTLVTSIACILLVGMVMKNAILMVDFALDGERRLNLPPLEAIRQAALQRARPITMTTLAAAFSALPIALGGGPGFELRQPLGIAIVGGMAVAQIFTLYTTPVIYCLISRLAKKPAAVPAA